MSSLRTASTSTSPTEASPRCVAGELLATYRLGPVVATNERGEPLFDLDEADIALADFNLDSAPLAFYTRPQLRDLAAAMYGLYAHFGARVKSRWNPDRTPPCPWDLMRWCRDRGL